MTRRLFNVAAAASLVLCVATAVLWVRSHRMTERVSWLNAGGSRTVVTGSGRLTVELTLVDWSANASRFHGPQYTRDPAGGTFNFILLLCHEAGQRTSDWAGCGFEWSQVYRPRGVRYVYAAAPMWGVMTLTGLLPLGATVLGVRGRYRRARRVGEHRCGNCGYDLRATPERCPECGEKRHPG